MGNLRCIAVDWSGNARSGAQRQHIWVAEAAQGRLVQLKMGRTRDEVVDWLSKQIRGHGPLVIGLDFAFSFPEWYVRKRNCKNVRQLWALAAVEGEDWLKCQTGPFWGRRGSQNPTRPADLTEDRQFRETDWVHYGKSVFQVSGGGTVGTGSIRGFPYLANMQKAGATIWPFDDPEPGKANVVEIYPRVFYRDSVTQSKGQASRRSYLKRNYPGLRQQWRDFMTESPDAFDAGVSALVMSANIEDLRGLRQATEPRVALEGEIWAPKLNRWVYQ